MAAPAFGLLAAGRPVATDWRVASETKLVMDVPSPATVTELSVFTMPGVALPPDRGVVVYWAAPPFTEWAPLGALGPARPSITVRPGWSAMPELARAPAVQVGLSVEPVDAVASAASALEAGEWDKLGFAQLLAADLAAFMSSFSQVTAAGERLVLPPDALDRWYKKFSDRWRREPGFLYRRSAA